MVLYNLCIKKDIFYRLLVYLILLNHDSLTICQYYQLSEYVIVSEIFVNIPNVILSNVIPKELSYI